MLKFGNGDDLAFFFLVQREKRVEDASGDLKTRFLDQAVLCFSLHVQPRKRTEMKRGRKSYEML